MFFDLNSCVDITSHYSWKLISLSIKNIVVRIRNSLLNRDLNDLLLLFYSFSLTNFAFIFLVHSFASSSTFIAFHLGLSHYSRTNLNHFNSNSDSLTILTFYRITTSFSLTIRTNSVSCDRYFFHTTCINFLKSYFN